MTEDQKPRIAPPPSVDDVLSSLTAESRIGQVDFSVALAPDPTSRAAKDDVGANRPDPVRTRTAAARRSAPIASVPEPEPEPEPAEAELLDDEPVAEEPVAEDAVLVEEPVVEEPKPAKAPAKPKKVRLPTPAEPAAEPVAEPVVEPEPEPEAEPEPAARIPAAPAEPATEPAPAVDVAREVEEVAEGVIARMRAAEDATLRHLDAMQTEATRRYELVTAQAELDAELIRLQSRREAHAIVSAARMRAGEADDLHDDPGDTGHRLAVLGDAVSRVADSTESLLATRQRAPERPSGS